MNPAGYLGQDNPSWRNREKWSDQDIGMIQYFTQHGLSFMIDIFRLCLWLVLLSVIFVPLERWFALHPQKLLRPGMGVDLVYFFLGGVLPAILMSVPLAVVALGAHRLVPHGFLATVAGAPLWVRAIASLLVGETGYYWGHRALHAVPMLWRFHAIHHSAEQIDFLVNTRAHPIDLVFGRLCGTIPLYVLGLAGPSAAGSAMPVLVVVVGTVWGFFIHANVRWRFGPLEWLISTPAFHHWHHAVDPADRNFASTLPFLDVIFGTHHSPKGQRPSRYGIKDPIPASLGAQLIRPFLDGGPINRDDAGQVRTSRPRTSAPS
jgi:sterol desaturase/sphingolipid hydroxylase (fatty acid hydroxylase superfamily)